MTTSTSGSCASLASRSVNRLCWRCRRASSTSRERAGSTAPQRELVEELGKTAESWTELKRFWVSPGLTDEEMTIFLATGLRDVEHEADPEERIEIVKWPLSDLDGAIEECADSKSLVGLLMLRDLLAE